MNKYDDMLKCINEQKRGKEQINISDLARVCSLTAESLRKYDRLGILVPYRKENSYRMYSSWELTKILRARQFRSEGASLSDINNLFHLEDPEDGIHLIVQREEEIRREIEEKQKLLQWLEYRKQQLQQFCSNKKSIYKEHSGRIYCCIYMAENTMTAKSGKEMKQLQEWVDAMPYVSVYYIGDRTDHTVSCLGITEEEREMFHLEYLREDFIVPEGDYIAVNDDAYHSREHDTSDHSIISCRNKAAGYGEPLDDVFVIRMYDYIQVNGEYTSVNKMMFAVKNQ